MEDSDGYPRPALQSGADKLGMTRPVVGLQP